MNDKFTARQPAIILRIAGRPGQCDGVRCDRAMLVLPARLAAESSTFTRRDKREPPKKR